MNIDPAAVAQPPWSDAFRTGFATLGFSQLGEDAVIQHLLAGKRDGFYVDVGCHHPFKYSNTAVLYQFYSWHGLNVDMDEDLIAVFDQYRQRDRNVVTGVGLEDGFADATFFQESAVNSMHPATIAEFSKHFPARFVKRVPVRPLAAILIDHLADGQQIDFMNIDVEGMDYDVLRSNDWDRFRPRVLAIEAHGFDPSQPDQNPSFIFLRDRGYRLNSHLVVTSLYTTDT